MLVAAFGDANGNNPAGSHPQGIITDAAGNLYWAEHSAHCVKRWNISVPPTAPASQGVTVIAGACQANVETSK